MYKKSQLKMFETIAVLVVFFFILVIGLMFYSSAERKSLGKTADEFKQMKDVEKAQLIAYLPELECPTTLETENCIDLYKVLVAKDIFNDKDYYYDIFGYSTITIYDMDDNDYLIYDEKPEKIASSSRINVPVSLYDDTTKQKKVGILNITIY